MSKTSLFLVRFDKRSRMIPATEKINSMESVKSWDAVDGFYGLVVRATKEQESIGKQLRALDGLDRLARCDLESDSLPYESESDNLQAYLFIEADNSQVEKLCSILNAIENVEFCLRSTGDFDLVVMVCGSDFDAIDRTIDETIHPLDGILRMKRSRIIELDRM